MAQRPGSAHAHAAARRRVPAKPKFPGALSDASLPEQDLADDCIRRSLSYRDLDVSQRKAESFEVECCSFQNVNLAESKFERAVFSDVGLEQCDLANLAAHGSSLIRTVLGRSRMTGASLTECALRDVSFESCRMDLAAFRFCRFSNCIFTDCKLSHADFQNADLRTVRFENCDLTGVQFSNALMEGAYFADCSLLDISGVASLKGATVKSHDAIGLLYSLAGTLGIRIDDD
jgi:uncharacterized protein YjbI with pentapeptide repeats